MFKTLRHSKHVNNFDGDLTFVNNLIALEGDLNGDLDSLIGNELDRLIDKDLGDLIGDELDRLIDKDLGDLIDDELDERDVMDIVEIVFIVVIYTHLLQ